jgi:hypothetical protein
MRDKATEGTELLNNTTKNRDQLLDELGSDYLLTLMNACDAAGHNLKLLRCFPDSALRIVIALATSALAEKLAQPIIDRLRENN